MKRPPVEMETCGACGGLGEKPGSHTGTVMRLEREGRGVTRAALVPHFYKPESRETYSIGYLIDLERNSRAWSVQMISSYRDAIEAAVQTRLSKKAEVRA